MTLSSAEKHSDVCPWHFPKSDHHQRSIYNSNGEIVADVETNCTNIEVYQTMGNSHAVKGSGSSIGCNPLSSGSDKKYVSHNEINGNPPEYVQNEEKCSNKLPLIKADNSPLLKYPADSKTLTEENRPVQNGSTLNLERTCKSGPNSRCTTPITARKLIPRRESPVPPIDSSGGKSSSSNSLKDSQAKDIMISYSHQDKAIMTRLKEALEDHHISVWVDVVGLNAGVNFLNKIGQAIIDSKMFITLLTDRTVSSKFCQDELALAYISNKPIFPVSVQPQEEIFPRIPTGMKLQLARFEWTQISDDSFDSDFKVLLSKLKQCLAEIEGVSEARDQVSPLSPITTDQPDGKLSRKPVLKKRPTRRQIYCRPNRSLSRCNSIIEQTDEIDSNAEFWDRNFQEAKSVPWESFEQAFMKDYEKQLNMTYNAASDREWFIDILKKELEVEDGNIFKEKYKEFIMDEEDGKMKEQPILKCVNDLAVENYTMREVFNMESSVRLDAINNLAKFGSPAVVEALLDLLDDQEHDVRASACISLAKSKAGCLEMKIERLMRCLRDKDRFVRESACVALGYLKADTAVSALLQIWRNDFISSVREAAELALKQIGGDEVNKAMKMTKVLTAEIEELIKVLTGKNIPSKNPSQMPWMSYTLPHNFSAQNGLSPFSNGPSTLAKVETLPRKTSNYQ